LTGPRFRHRIEAVVERFTDMQADLDRIMRLASGSIICSAIVGV
jgi:hypothetical protein